MRTRFWLCAAAAWLGCGQSAQPSTPTQVMVQISLADASLKRSVTHLRVRASFHLGNNAWRRPVQDTYPTARLSWPVEIPVLPRTPGESSGEFEVLAEALQGPVLLAQARTITSFRANERLSLPLELFACPAAVSPECEPRCVGFGCKSCGPARTCNPVMIADPDDLEDPPATRSDAATEDVEADGAVVTPGAPASDAATTTVQDAGPAAPAGECDQARPCEAGHRCVAMRCESLCNGFTCDANSTCSLVHGAPVCRCDPKFLVSSSGACVRDVTCEELQCVNASCLVNPGTQIRECVCHPGYNRNGKSCDPVVCPTPTIANGTVAIPNGTTVNSTVTFRCNQGYHLTGGGALEHHRSCLADMTWSNGEVMCAITRCGEPPAPTSPTGTVSYSQTDYNSRATYRCGAGYQLQGAEQITCRADGTWSAGPPACIPL